jgi:hypothetical protein
MFEKAEEEQDDDDDDGHLSFFSVDLLRRCRLARRLARAAGVRPAGRAGLAMEGKEADDAPLRGVITLLLMKWRDRLGVDVRRGHCTPKGRN